jgi:hypothetical protein
MLTRLVAGVGLAVALTATPAHAATIIFSDNFNTENGGVGALNYNSFANFTVVAGTGTVDLIGNGFFEFPPVTNGHGLYVDLDGSTSDAGLMLADPIPVLPGDYELFFQLAGNQRQAGNDVVSVNLFLNNVLFFTGNVLVPQDLPFIGFPLPFTLASGGNLTFSFQNDGNNNIGALLDNITLTALPEPGSLLLLGSALALRLARRRG